MSWNRLFGSQSPYKNKVHAKVQFACNLLNMSAKNFVPPINDSESAARWLRILTGDLALRLMEDEDHRLPKTITVHHKSGGTTKSRQAPLPNSKEMDKAFLFNHAFSVWRGIETEGRAFPSSNISVGISGFEEVEDGMQGIQGFLVPQQTAHHAQPHSYSGNIKGDGDSSRKRKQSKEGIAKFFSKRDKLPFDGIDHEDTITPLAEAEPQETCLCSKCHKRIRLEEVEIHEDYHVALELSKVSPIRTEPSTQPKARHLGKEGVKKVKPFERGQRKLDFGAK